MRLLCLLLVFTCVLAFSVHSSALATASFATVTAENWSYIAVKNLINSGMISDDGLRFANGSPTNRHEIAILIANGQSNITKATPDQKALLTKLAQEYSGELESIGAAPQKNAASPITFLAETRLQYDNTSLKRTDGGGWPAGNVSDKNQFWQRFRLYMNGAVGDDWIWNARYNQQTNNINLADSSSKFDRFCVTGKNILGGQLSLGKQSLFPAKGGIFGYSGDANGLLYTTKLGENVTWKLGDYRLLFSALSAAGETTQDAFYTEITWKPSKTSDLSFYRVRNNFNSNIRDIDLYGIAGAATINNNGLTFAFEAAKNHAADSAYNGKSGYILYLYSKYAPSWRSPWNTEGVTPANPFVKGDSGWVLSYRHLPNGVCGWSNRSAWTMAPVTSDTNGVFQNTLNDVNALRIDYHFVPWKNVVWVIAYDSVKPINATWTNNAFQTALVFMFK